jgi:hypothetical protein
VVEERGGAIRTGPKFLSNDYSETRTKRYDASGRFWMGYNLGFFRFVGLGFFLFP